MAGSFKSYFISPGMWCAYYRTWVRVFDHCDHSWRDWIV